MVFHVILLFSKHGLDLYEIVFFDDAERVPLADIACNDDRSGKIAIRLYGALRPIVDIGIRDIAVAITEEDVVSYAGVVEKGLLAS